MSEDLVLLAQYDESAEAQLTCNFLEHFGIPTFIQDQHMIEMMWTHSNALDGVKVYVRGQDEAEARDLLQTAVQIEEIGPTTSHPDDICPNCGGKDGTRERSERKWGAISLLTGVPIPLFGPRMRCRTCDHLWKPTHQEFPDIPAYEEESTPRLKAKREAIFRILYILASPIPWIAIAGIIYYTFRR